MRVRHYIKLVLVLCVVTLLSGCFFLPVRDGYVKILVYSGDTNAPSAAVKAMEVLFVGIQNLTPYERYDIAIQSSAGVEIARYALNATDAGELPPTPMWPEAGLVTTPDDDGPKNPSAELQVGSYSIILTGPGTNVTFPFSVITRNTPFIWSADNEGNICNAFQAGNVIHVAGMKFEANKTVDVYIMRDRDIWNNNEIIDDAGSYFRKIIGVTTDTEGHLLAALGNAAIDTVHGNCANFDIIVDVNRNGIFDVYDAVDSKSTSGFVVQVPPQPELRAMQIASNGHALDYTTHWNDTYYYPDLFNYDGSDTGFYWEGFGRGVFCILNPLIDDTDPATHLVYWSQVQVWVIKVSDYNSLTPGLDGQYDLTGLDVSDALGRPDLVTVQRTCSNGAGSILIWQAPLAERRPSQPAIGEGEGIVVIIEKPDEVTGSFDNKFDPVHDYIDGDLNGLENDDRGFSVINVL